MILLNDLIDVLMLLCINVNYDFTESKILKLSLSFRDFINDFSTRATGFYSRAKLFELNFFLRKTFHYMITPGRQNGPHYRSVCPVPGPF